MSQSTPPAQTPPPEITLRPALRADIPSLARIANAANASSALHKHMAPGQTAHPASYHRWRVNILRERFAAPNLRTIVAVDSSQRILGFASWALEDARGETGLYERWVRLERGGLFRRGRDALERGLLEVEKGYARYVTDYSTDYAFIAEFLRVIMSQGATKGRSEAEHTRPACLHCHQVVVDPGIQARGIGKRLIRWGQELAEREGVPLFLEANLEVVGFYEKVGFSRMGRDVLVEVEKKGEMGGKGEVVRVSIPAFVWEGEGNGGRWLRRDESWKGEGVRWVWKDKGMKN